MKYRFADIVIDTSSHCVMRRAQVVRLTNIEFRLLEYLAQNADHICSREDVLNSVLGQQFQYDTGTIDVHLHSLRRKLGFAFSSFWSILELFQQEKRVERGWFPKNPKRK